MDSCVLCIYGGRNLVGGGHAGCEAAIASARLGAKVLLC